LLLTNGTLLFIQNETWNGKLGFQEAPSQNFIVPIAEPRHYDYSPQGIMGKQHYERGLMWVDMYQTGHMQPEYQPRASLRHIMWVLGRIDEL
jgi:carboxypeptidase D